MKQEEPILVAIHCLVYNHEPYLRDCFEGFVMQKTNFRFVAIVHDDCSTDHSADIIREYEAKYPDIFRPIYETENQYSKPDGSLGRIMNAAIDATGAKYIAMCEGDDYWTDPYKLQKQVDFLEKHPEYALCCHGYRIYNTADESIKDKIVSLPDNAKDGYAFSREENMRRWYSKTLTVVCRVEANLSVPNISLFKYWCDTYNIYYILKQGKGYYMPFIGAVYREHNGGVFSSLSSVQKGMMNIRQYNELCEHNPEDTDLVAMLQELIVEQEDELVWLIRDKEWKTEYFKAILEISSLLLKKKQYSHLLKWRGQLCVASLKRLKRCALYQSLRNIYRKTLSKR